jgi:5-methylcytosine-specific restriction enzyme A
MPLEPAALARLISDSCGLPFEGRQISGGNNRTFQISPAGVPVQNTFAIQTSVGWRSLEVSFMPGSFSGDFIGLMGESSSDSRNCSAAVLGKCVDDGASVSLKINGKPRNPRDTSEWDTDWSRFELGLRRGQLELANDDADTSKIAAWTQKVAAAIVALLPLERDEVREESLYGGFSEGAQTRIEVNHYERDRRNRAAALAIHGYACLACNSDLRDAYGAAAVGLIEVHHLTPVSKLGKNYHLNPATDLAPLCPNCHRVAHRRDPPFTIAELQMMMAGRYPKA